MAVCCVSFIDFHVAEKHTGLCSSDCVVFVKVDQVRTVLGVSDCGIIFCVLYTILKKTVALL